MILRHRLTTLDLRITILDNYIQTLHAMSQLAVTKSVHDNIPICDFKVWKNVEFLAF